MNDLINKAAATIVVTPYSVTYDANPHTATGTATGVLGETLAGLDLSESDLRKANLIGADPSSSKLDGAKLDDAKLDRVVELKPSELGWHADLALPLDHDWLLRLTPKDAQWRLRGRLVAGQGVALLEKGLKTRPDRWQYAHDIGFIHYWYTGNYREAATWFERAASMPKAPEWLRPLAGVTLASGGDRQGAQRLLQELLDLPAPRYFHHRLILDPDGRKLAKSRGDSGIAA